MGRPTTALLPPEGPFRTWADPYRNQFWVGSVNIPYYPQMRFDLLEQMQNVGLAPQGIYQYALQQYPLPVYQPPAPPYTPDEARTKARELLLMHLDEKQRADFEERQYFDIIKDHHRYRIMCNGETSSNIKLLDQKTRQVTSLCCYPSDRAVLPPEDVYLAQKLNIEASEADFLFAANHKRLTGAEADLESNPSALLKAVIILATWAVITILYFCFGR